MYNMLSFFSLFSYYFIFVRIWSLMFQRFQIPSIPNTKESASSVENFSINLKKKLIRSIDEDYCIYTFNRDFDEIRDIVW